MLQYLKAYKKESVIAPLFKMLEASFELLVPIVMANIIDVGIQNGDKSYIWRMCALMIGLGVLGLVCSLTAQYFAAKAAMGFGTALRKALFGHINSLSYNELDQIGTPTLITRMTSDINQAQTGVNMMLRLFLRSPFIVIGAVMMAFTISAKLTIIFLIAVPLIGLAIYLIPDFTGMTIKSFLSVVMDAMGQLFFSISVAMGIMVTYGSYAKKETNLMKSINQIEFFDTLVALLAGLMIIPAVYTFMGTEGMSAGPGLMFVSLPKVFKAMGSAGVLVGTVFFLMVSFAAVTSSVSVMEAIVSSMMDKFHVSRKKGTILTTLYGMIVGVIVCLGYNKLYFEFKLPNGTVAQILDVMDYISNNCLMPMVALLTCILIGWVVKPKAIIDEVTLGGYRFGREKLYIAMIKVIAPLMLLVLLAQSVGL